MLAFAKSKSPWHGARLGQVEPQSFTEADLGTVPVMTKADVMTNWDDIVTDRRLTLAGCNANIAAKLNGTCKDYYYLDDWSLPPAARMACGACFLGAGTNSSRSPASPSAISFATSPPELAERESYRGARCSQQQHIDRELQHGRVLWFGP